MDKYLFMKRVLDSLAQGPFFRRHFALCVRIGAVVGAMAGLVAFVNAWNFTANLEPARILGGLVYMLSLVAATYMAVHTMLIRANDIASLPHTGFTLIPMGAIVSLMVGEAYASVCAALAVGGGILIWFTGDGAYEVLQRATFFVPFQGGTTFAAGILFIIRGAIRAVAALFLGYLASELFIVVEKLAGNARLGTSGSE